MNNLPIVKKNRASKIINVASERTDYYGNKTLRIPSIGVKIGH